MPWPARARAPRDDAGGDAKFCHAPCMHAVYGSHTGSGVIFSFGKHNTSAEVCIAHINLHRPVKKLRVHSEVMLLRNHALVLEHLQ
jgi:hypothetical protein